MGRGQIVQDFEKSFEKASVVRCSVQLEAILGIFEDWKENVKGSLLPCYNSSERQPLDRIISSKSC